MLLLRDSDLDARRLAVSREGPLGALYDSLAGELEPLVGDAPFIPDAKALLSRAGGRCERDGATLDFDPASPNRHRCPTCGTLHEGELHHRAWITSYQLWLAERGVHAALFHVLRDDAKHATLARDIIGAYAERYLRYPNRDNVLGPTRLFFSTYLESIWLLQIAVAADLLAAAGDTSTADLARDRIVEPSSTLIAEYDEGMSNRQVWNNAALLASALLLRDKTAIERLVDGESGLRAHLSHALLSDGTWYEGENYHMFALRGLWYCVTLCEAHGIEIDPVLLQRFDRAFVAPYLSALPDFTLPSRKDSQYAVSLRQWRLAELAELGFARHGGTVLAGALARCYEPGLERRDTGRSRSTADVERNGPPGALTRADLGWRALLHALPELPPLPLAASSPRSAHLSAQGFAVFRREGDVYVGVDYGQSGGGHGHPDRLSLTLYQNGTRWLDDLGTGSYVDPSLHWYRSTLAHNAPLVDGKSQPLRDGALIAYDEREGFGWIVAEFRIPDDEVRLERTVVVAPGYLIDELRWTAAREVRVELPWHVDASATELAAGTHFRLQASARNHRGLLLHLTSDRPTELYSAEGPGQPPSTQRSFSVLRSDAREGVFRALISWTGEVLQSDSAQSGGLTVHSDGVRQTHRRDAQGWHVELFAGSAQSSIDLAGFSPVPDARQQTIVAPRSPTVLRRGQVPSGWLSEMSPATRGSLLMYELGEAHYRRSEDPWKAAGSPRATIALSAGANQLVVFATIVAGERHFAALDATNQWDNEAVDTMGAGVQLYVRAPDGHGAWMLVPERDGDSVRVRSIDESRGFRQPAARWRPHEDGYELRIELPLPATGANNEYPIDVDVLVNETTAERQRRRGQLVMSGARGEFVYLRGDRHDLARLIPIVLVS